MTPNNEIESIVAEVSNILRNRLNNLVTNVKNDENNEAILNLPIVKQVLANVNMQKVSITNEVDNSLMIKKLQDDSQVHKQQIESLFNMCSNINNSLIRIQTSIYNLSNTNTNNLPYSGMTGPTEPVSQTKENITLEIKEKPKPNIILVEEDEDDEEEEQSVSLEVASEAEEEEQSVSNETLEEADEEETEEADEEETEEQETAASEAEEEEEQLVSNETLEVSSKADEEEAASEAEEEEQEVEVVASEVEEEEAASEAEEVEEEEVASEAEEEEQEQQEEGLEVFEIEIDDVTYFATDEENGDLYEVDKDGDVGKKIGFIKDGEVTFI